MNVVAITYFILYVTYNDLWSSKMGSYKVGMQTYHDGISDQENAEVAYMNNSCLYSPARKEKKIFLRDSLLY
jgi:hypothetical protein